MKRLLTTLLAAILVFTLVACGNNKKTNDDKANTKSETTLESKGEQKDNKKKDETKQEKKDDKSTTGELDYMSIAITSNLVVANQGDKQNLYALKAKNELSLSEGFKYEFKFNPTNLKYADPNEKDPDDLRLIEVEKVEILGKKIGYPITGEVAKKIVDKLDDNNKAIVLDTRSKEEFAKGHIDDAINVPENVIKEITKDSNRASLGLEKVNRNSVVIVIGDQAKNKELAKKLYDLFGVNVILDAGSMKDYKGELERN